jgi:hypothetical protein
MLKKEGKINDAVIENMLSWRHTGFHVHIGGGIWPEDETALGNLAKYIVRASFSQKRMLYIPAEKSADGLAKVVYQSKDGKTEQTFDALDRLARLVVHIPNKCEQLVRYVGYYSNKSRGMRKKAETDDIVPSIAPGELTSKQFRSNWARLIQKIYEVDPLRCPDCKHPMRILSILESGPIVKKILEHLDLWDTRNHDPPAEDDLNTPELVYDDSDSQSRNTTIGTESKPSREKSELASRPGRWYGFPCPRPLRQQNRPDYRKSPRRWRERTSHK